MPWLKRQLLVRGIIVPKRYRESAKGYRSIWTDKGSPLLVHGRNVQQALQQKLGPDFYVELAMRYRHPSIEQGLESLISKQVSTIVILPLFPQYASATTGSVHQKVMHILQKRLVIPKLVFIDHYCDRPDVIDSFCTMVGKAALDASDHVLFSFHGLPKRHLTNISTRCCTAENCCATPHRYCYAAQCHAMARAIAKNLAIPKKNIRCASIAPRQGTVARTLYQRYAPEACPTGKKNVLIFSPSFVCDCLETTYEIQVEYNHTFKQAGGHSLTLVPALMTIHLDQHPTFHRP